MSSRHSPTSTDAAVDIARRFAEEVWNGREYTAIPELVHRDYVLHDPAAPDPIRGRDALERHIRDSVRAFPDLHVEPRLGLGEGETVMTYYTTTGTFDGAYGPLSPTGRRVAVDGTAVIRYEDGKMREEHLYYDTADFRKQLGVTGLGFLRQVPSIARWTLRTVRARLFG
ncbi:ester cyclase [Halomarina litorea]|uniref:ester cyclase n=1 Tax=Halomarina litorea TaxID=2961595 RepID=UPI0020C20A6E|nr:ester cyclase [Halomarina sp. BCD28]